MSSTEDLEITSTSDATAITLTIVGEIDVNTCGRLHDALAAAIGRHVRLDLSGVGFIDSSGLRSIISGQRQISEAGGSLTIVGLSAPARRLLEITGLLELFGVE